MSPHRSWRVPTRRATSGCGRSRLPCPYVVLDMTRRGDRDVAVSAIPASHPKMGLTPVLIDDIVSSARTMIETVRQLRAAGSAPPTSVAMHGVFATGAAEIVTTNSIAYASNGIDLCAALIEPVKGQWSKTTGH